MPPVRLAMLRDLHCVHALHNSRCSLRGFSWPPMRPPMRLPMRVACGPPRRLPPKRTCNACLRHRGRPIQARQTDAAASTHSAHPPACAWASVALVFGSLPPNQPAATTNSHSAVPCHGNCSVCTWSHLARVTYMLHAPTSSAALAPPPNPPPTYI